MVLGMGVGETAKQKNSAWQSSGVEEGSQIADRQGHADASNIWSSVQKMRLQYWCFQVAFLGGVLCLNEDVGNIPDTIVAGCMCAWIVPRCYDWSVVLGSSCARPIFW